MGEHCYGVILGWATPTKPIVRYVNSPDHIRCIAAILEIEAKQPWDMEKQRYRNEEIEWSVINDESSTD